MLSIAKSKTYTIHEFLEEIRTKEEVKPHKNRYLSKLILVAPLLEDTNIPSYANQVRDISMFGKLDGVMEQLKKISDFFDFILHPTRVLLLVWNWTVEISYFLCIALCLFGFFMALIGNKKYSKLIPGSIIGYLFIQILNSVIVG